MERNSKNVHKISSFTHVGVLTTEIFKFETSSQLWSFEFDYVTMRSGLLLVETI